MRFLASALVVVFLSATSAFADNPQKPEKAWSDQDLDGVPGYLDKNDNNSAIS